MQLCISKCAASRGQASFFRCRPPRRLAIVRANSEFDKAPSTSSEVPPEASEARIERLEASVRRKAPVAPQASRQIPIKGMTQQQNDNPNSYWREGQLFPDGWEQMSLPKKINELYVGERGMLFWLNKIAYAACFGLVGLWVLFRFVGPSLGLYELSV